MAFATFDGDGSYGFSIIFLFVSDFLFFFQLFEDVLGFEKICLALHSYEWMYHTEMAAIIFFTATFYSIYSI